MDNKFRQDYRKVPLNQQISPKAIEWYVRWARAFDKALPLVPLHSAQAIYFYVVKSKDWFDPFIMISLQLSNSFQWLKYIYPGK